MPAWVMTPLELLAEHDRDDEIAQLFSTRTVQLDSALLRTTALDGDKSAWTPEQQQAANYAIAQLADKLAAAEGKLHQLIGTIIDVTDTSIAADLRQITGDIARYHLYTDVVPDQVRQLYEDAMNYLSQISQYQRTRLGVVLDAGSHPMGPISTGLLERY